MVQATTGAESIGTSLNKFSKMNSSDQSTEGDDQFIDAPYGPMFAKCYRERLRQAEAIAGCHGHEAVMIAYKTVREKGDPSKSLEGFWRKVTFDEAWKIKNNEKRHACLLSESGYLIRLNSNPEDPYAVLSRNELYELVHETLRRLPQPEQKLIRLHFIERVSYDEMLELPDYRQISYGTLRTRVSRALDLFEKDLLSLQKANQEQHAASTGKSRGTSSRKKLTIKL